MSKIIYDHISHIWASLEAQMLKNLPVMQVWSLGQEDPLEKGIATHSCIPAWRITWVEEPGGLQSMGSWRVKQDWTTNTFTFRGFPGDTSKEHTCQRRRQRRPGFDSWVGKISWRRTCEPTPVCFPRESYGQRSLVGYRPEGLKSRTRLRWLACTPHIQKTDSFPHYLPGYEGQQWETSQKRGL